MELTIETVKKAIANISEEEQSVLLLYLKIGLLQNIKDNGDMANLYLKQDMHNFAEMAFNQAKNEGILYRDIRNYEDNGV